MDCWQVKTSYCAGSCYALYVASSPKLLPVSNVARPFLAYNIRNWEWPGDEATLYACTYIHILLCNVIRIGISLWDCVVSNILSRGGSGLHLDLLTHYHPLTLPANATFTLLLTIVMLSLIDRYATCTVMEVFLTCAKK